MHCPASRNVYWQWLLSSAHKIMAYETIYSMHFNFILIASENWMEDPISISDVHFATPVLYTCLWWKWMLILVSVLHRSTRLWNLLSQNSLTGNFITSWVGWVTHSPMWINSNKRPITDSSIFTLPYLMTMRVTGSCHRVFVSACSNSRSTATEIHRLHGIRRSTAVCTRTCH